MSRSLQVGFVALLWTYAAASQGESVAWIRQLGTTNFENSNGVSADGLGNVYLSGETSGNLSGAIAGISDAFVSKFDAFGNLLWIRQHGTSGGDAYSGVSADGLGNIYLSGRTTGSLGAPYAGGNSDAFVSKYDAAGLLLWTRQLGTQGYDAHTGVSADRLGNVYLSGVTHGSLSGPIRGLSDAFISKYNTAGDLLWTRQFGTTDLESSTGVSTDGLGNIYVCGATTGRLGQVHRGNYDAFVSKYDAFGNLLWARQLGSVRTDGATGVSADGLGNVYLSGYTTGSLGGLYAGGDFDAFVSKYDAFGNLLWTRQFGTTDRDFGSGVSADGLGNVYLSGATTDNQSGPNAGNPGTVGDYGAFVSKYDAAGELMWTRRSETTVLDYGSVVSADGLGNVYLSGSIGSDAYVAKIADPVVPEPSALRLAAMGLVGLVRSVGSSRRSEQ